MTFQKVSQCYRRAWGGREAGGQEGSWGREGGSSERRTWRDTSSRDRHLGRHIAKARLSSIGASYFRKGHGSQRNRAAGDIGRRNRGALATLADVIASPATLADVIATPGTLADVIRRWVHVPILSVLGTSCTDFVGFRYIMYRFCRF